MVSAKKTVEVKSERCCSERQQATNSCEKTNRNGNGAQTDSVDACCGAKREAESVRKNCCSREANTREYIPRAAAANTQGCLADEPTKHETDPCTTECCKGTASTDYNPNDPTDTCGDGCCTDPTAKDDALDGGTDTCKDNCCTAPGSKDSIEETGSCVDDCCKLLPEQQASATPKSCSSHLEAAFARYERLLAQGQCLCRSVLDQFGFCCCSVTPDGRILTTDACGPYARLKDGAENEKRTGDMVVHSRCSDRLEVVDEKATAKGASYGTSDVEKQAAQSHVVVSVSGMTCTGCSRKMMNVLEKLPGVSNGKVTFVSGIAELDVDDSTAQTEDVLRQIEKETGFKCSRIKSDLHHVDVLMSASLAQEMQNQGLSGVDSIAKMNKTTWRITYDPRVIGARSLMKSSIQLAPPDTEPSVSESRRRLYSMLLATMVAAAFTLPVVVLNWAPNPVPDFTVSIVSLVLATVVQGIAVPEFYVGALKSLIYSRIIEMDMLVVISITAAYFYSVIAFALTESGYELEQEAFFETSSLLITLVLFGRLMAAWARARAVASVSTRSLQADTALIMLADGITEKVDARLLQYEDEIMIPAHSRIVTDGQVTSGDSHADESMVTGESVPVPKTKGDPVIAGTINGTGPLRVSLSRLPGENSITDIAHLVENALATKPRVQDMADKVASWFVPAVVGIALVVFAIWIGIALRVRGDNAGGAVGTALTYGIAVLAVSCPCALGLAVPMVLVIAGGVAARAGVIIKAADATERGFKVTDVVFDKTGTLTKGDLKVVTEETISTSLPVNEALRIAQALVEGNEHPVSKAIAAHLSAWPATKAMLEHSQSIPGAGVQAVYGGLPVRAGNPFWLKLQDHPDVAPLLEQGMTSFCILLDGDPVSVFGLKSTLRDEAAGVVAELQRRNITCHVVSGDAPKVVQDVAQSLGIEAANTASRASPADKQRFIERLQSERKVVLFCGDGTNDAVAVAQANVGVQIGSASDVTSAVADVVLLGGLDGVLKLLDISKMSFRRIQFNLIWSAVYNVFAILLAAGAFVKFRIPPGYAGLGEIVSVGPVILVAATLAMKTMGKT